jgi:hypothetical protein
MNVYNSILEEQTALEIAKEMNFSSVEDAVKFWFINTFNEEFSEQTIKYKKYICDIPEISCQMYFDYGAGYYFCVKN